LTLGVPIWQPNNTQGGYLDTLIIPTINQNKIPANSTIVITIYPCTNPPSNESLSGFQIETGYWN
jgi:hypothetical protein